MHSAKECILQLIIFRLHAYAFFTPTATNNFWQSRVPRLTRQKNITPQKTGKPMILILSVCPTQKLHQNHDLLGSDTMQFGVQAPILAKNLLPPSIT